MPSKTVTTNSTTRVVFRQHRPVKVNSDVKLWLQHIMTRHTGFYDDDGQHGIINRQSVIECYVLFHALENWTVYVPVGSDAKLNMPVDRKLGETKLNYLLPGMNGTPLHVIIETNTMEATDSESALPKVQITKVRLRCDTKAALKVVNEWRPSISSRIGRGIVLVVVELAEEIPGSSGECGLDSQ